MSRLLHINGPPGIGKSTLARRYVQDHHGVLNCDIDVLRTLIGGWQHNVGEAGALIRAAALAMITAYLETGHDVVVPQMLTKLTEIERFEAAANAAGATFVSCLVMDAQEASVARFHRRGATGDTAWHDEVRAIVEASGGDDSLRRCHSELEALLPLRPATHVIASNEGETEQTYLALLATMR